MYTNLDIEHLVRERDDRVLRGVRAERLRGRLQASRAPRSAGRRIAELLTLRRGFEVRTATHR